MTENKTAHDINWMIHLQIERERERVIQICSRAYVNVAPFLPMWGFMSSHTGFVCIFFIIIINNYNNNKKHIQILFTVLFFMSSHIHFNICLCMDLLFIYAFDYEPTKVYFLKKIDAHLLLICTFNTRKFSSEKRRQRGKKTHTLSMKKNYYLVACSKTDYNWTNKWRAFIIFRVYARLSTSEAYKLMTPFTQCMIRAQTRLSF